MTSDFSDITLAKGQSVLFKGENESTFSYFGHLQFTMSGRIKASGNIMTLLDGDNPGTEITEGYAFWGLFAYCNALKDVSGLSFPATTLTESCYSCMFSYCEDLKTAPLLLPATTLAESCYEGMFNYCLALEYAPELPATTLTVSCYKNMFNGCENLKTAPELPATTLADYCYDSMFEYCEALEHAPELPATILAPSCYVYMFHSCKNLSSVTMLATDVSAEDCLIDFLVDAGREAADPVLYVDASMTENETILENIDMFSVQAKN